MVKKLDLDGLSFKDFKLNNEGSFSITKPYESYQIVILIENFIKVHEKVAYGIEDNLKNKIITDATACMGGDLIRFSKYFKLINGIEVLQENFDLLVYNCKQFNCQNVNLFCQNYLEIYDKLKQDVIYLDPPWGGIDYKSKDTISLKLGNIEIWQLIRLIREKKLANFVFIKAPMNICLDNIDYNSICIIFNRSKVASFKLVCISLMQI